jgi:hypothetical protein
VNELTETVTAGYQEYEEIIEEYEEEILVPKEVLEPLLTDFADTPPAQVNVLYLVLVISDNT